MHVDALADQSAAALPGSSSQTALGRIASCAGRRSRVGRDGQARRPRRAALPAPGTMTTMLPARLAAGTVPASRAAGAARCASGAATAITGTRLLDRSAAYRGRSRGCGRRRRRPGAATSKAGSAVAPRQRALELVGVARRRPGGVVAGRRWPRHTGWDAAAPRDAGAPSAASQSRSAPAQLRSAMIERHEALVALPHVDARPVHAACSWVASAAARTAPPPRSRRSAPGGPAPRRPDAGAQAVDDEVQRARGDAVAVGAARSPTCASSGAVLR